MNDDRNVNPEELAYWVRNYAGWLRIEYHVGGDIAMLKRLIADELKKAAPQIPEEQHAVFC